MDPYDAGADDDYLRLSEPTGVESAWRAAQEQLSHLSGGFTVAGVTRGRGPNEWMAEASGRRGAFLRGYGHDPESALNDLEDCSRAER